MRRNGVILALSKTCPFDDFSVISVSKEKQSFLCPTPALIAQKGHHLSRYDVGKCAKREEIKTPSSAAFVYYLEKHLIQQPSID